MVATRKIRNWLSGDILRSEWLRNQYKLIGLIVALVFVYILAGYESKRQLHHLTDMKKEMLDAKFEYMTISAKLVDATRPSQIAIVLEQQNSPVRENTVPPIKIEE